MCLRNRFEFLSREHYVMIPMPYGYSFFATMGQQIGSLFFGKSPLQTTQNLVRRPRFLQPARRIRVALATDVAHAHRSHRPAGGESLALRDAHPTNGLAVRAGKASINDVLELRQSDDEGRGDLVE